MAPTPKRSEQLIRRNKPEVPIDTVHVIGPVDIPDLGLPNAHPFVLDLYESMKTSGQSKYMEPSDWAYARLTMLVLNDMLYSYDDRGRRNIGAMKLTAVNQMLSSLLLTEGERRRVRMEIERNTETPEGKVLQVADLFRAQLSRQDSDQSP